METEKEKKPDAPTPEQKDYPKPEEKPADNKQTDDNGTAEKPGVIRLCRGIFLFNT